MLINVKVVGNTVSQDDAASQEGGTDDRQRQRPDRSKQEHKVVSYDFVKQLTRQLLLGFKAINKDWSTTELIGLPNFQGQLATDAGLLGCYRQPGGRVLVFISVLLGNTAPTLENSQC